MMTDMEFLKEHYGGAVRDAAETVRLAKEGFMTRAVRELGLKSIYPDLTVEYNEEACEALMDTVERLASHLGRIKDLEERETRAREEYEAKFGTPEEAEE